MLAFGAFAVPLTVLSGMEDLRCAVQSSETQTVFCAFDRYGILQPSPLSGKLTESGFAKSDENLKIAAQGL